MPTSHNIGQVSIQNIDVGINIYEPRNFEIQIEFMEPIEQLFIQE
jgi:hypothetical protein